MCLFVCLYTYVQIHLLPCISSVLHTSCEIHTCKVMTANENADKKFQKVLPVCTDDGTYSPIQQLDNGTRVCVDAFGEAVQLVPPSGKCSEWILFYYFCGDVAILSHLQPLPEVALLFNFLPMLRLSRYFFN